MKKIKIFVILIICSGFVGFVSANTNVSPLYPYKKDKNGNKLNYTVDETIDILKKDPSIARKWGARMKEEAQKGGKYGWVNYVSQDFFTNVDYIIYAVEKSKSISAAGFQKGDFSTDGKKADGSGVSIERDPYTGELWLMLDPNDLEHEGLIFPYDYEPFYYASLMCMNGINVYDTAPSPVTRSSDSEGTITEVRTERVVQQTGGGDTHITNNYNYNSGQTVDNYDYNYQDQGYYSQGQYGYSQRPTFGFGVQLSVGWNYGNSCCGHGFGGGSCGHGAPYNAYAYQPQGSGAPTVINNDIYVNVTSSATATATTGDVTVINENNNDNNPVVVPPPNPPGPGDPIEPNPGDPPGPGGPAEPFPKIGRDAIAENRSDRKTTRGVLPIKDNSAVIAEESVRSTRSPQSQSDIAMNDSRGQSKPESVKTRGAVPVKDNSAVDSRLARSDSRPNEAIANNSGRSVETTRGAVPKSRMPNITTPSRSNDYSQPQSPSHQNDGRDARYAYNPNQGTPSSELGNSRGRESHQPDDRAGAPNYYGNNTSVNQPSRDARYSQPQVRPDQQSRESRVNHPQTRPEQSSRVDQQQRSGQYSAPQQGRNNYSAPSQTRSQVGFGGGHQGGFPQSSGGNRQGGGRR